MEDCHLLSSDFQKGTFAGQFFAYVLIKRHARPLCIRLAAPYFQFSYDNTRQIPWFLTVLMRLTIPATFNGF